MSKITNIHSTAIISETAVIGEGTSVGPYSVIGPNVKLGANCSIRSHVVVEGNTKIGDNTNIFQFASVGAEPQDLKYNGEDSLLEIGENNTIREYATIQPGTSVGGMVTKIGSNNLIMACSHIAHDAHMGDNNILANCAALAGHVQLGSNVRVMGLAGVHQFVRLGDYSFVGAGSMVSQDVPPCCMVQGDRAELIGLNLVGMKRAGFDREEVREYKEMFKELFIRKAVGESFSERTERLLEIAEIKRVQEFLEFISSSKRGVVSIRGEVLVSDDE